MGGQGSAMSDYSEAGLTRSHRVGTNIFKAQSLRRLLPVGIAVALSLVIALVIYGQHLWDLSVPIDGDVRAHIFKIELVAGYLSRFSFPEWVTSWYHGYPFDLYYPPGFYILGAAFTFILGNAVAAYKFLLFFALISNGLVTYYFARKFLRLDAVWSILCLVAYESSTPLLVNYLYGEGPNLTGWSLSLVFLVTYLGNIERGATRGLRDILFPSLLLGAAVLIHPFPVIFVSLAIALYHLIGLLHRRSLRTALTAYLPYLAAVYLTGIIIGAHYWVPALLNLNYASSIYTMTRYMWPNGMTYVLVICLLALFAGLVSRWKIRSDIRLDFLIACLLLATTLGLGATRYFPFGLGVLLHEFRFATIMAPFFAVLLVLYLLAERQRYPDRDRILTAFLSGSLLVVLVFAAERNYVPGLLSHAALLPEIGAMLQFIGEFFYREKLEMVIPIIVSTIVMLTIFSPDARPDINRRIRRIFPLFAAFSFILLTSVVPLVFTYEYATLSRLFTYVDNYETGEYAAVMERATGGRMIVSMIKGALCEGDSPVTFGARWGVETVNGPYSQGDPKFFRHTVHLEWEDRWLENRVTRENLMQESGAKYVFVRNPRPLPENLDGLKTGVNNTFGALLELEQDVSRAASVSPVLLDVNNPADVADFFNILLPGGYRMAFVDAHEVPAELKDSFDYVVTDDESKLEGYRGKQVLLIQDIPESEAIGSSETPGVVSLKFPFSAFIQQLFYHGEQGNGMGWVFFDNTQNSRPTPEQRLLLERAAELARGFTERLAYAPVKYDRNGNGIRLESGPGFTLVKDSYFPYWSAADGTVIPTTQGFMLVYSNDANAALDYRKPFVNQAASAVTIGSLIAVPGVLIALAVTGRRRKEKASSEEKNSPLSS